MMSPTESASSATYSASQDGDTRFMLTPLIRRRHVFALLAAAFTAQAFPARRAGLAPRPKKLLVLGGTQFLGVHIVQQALARGHQVTLFNRGQTRTDLFPDVEKLRGDRDGPLDALRDRQWDAVIDDSGTVASRVTASAKLLAGSVRQYVFVSSTDVYAKFERGNREDSARVARPASDDPEALKQLPYDVAKRASEDSVWKFFPRGAFIVRPAQIVGPEDPADRIAYWLADALRGGPFPVPGVRTDPIQIVDARDLAAFIVAGVEDRTRGAYNVCSAPGQFDLGRLVGACVTAVQAQSPVVADPRPVWLGSERTVSLGLANRFPLWMAPNQKPGLVRSQNQRALRAGLQIRPLEETVRDTLQWLLQTPQALERAQRLSLSASEREAALSLA